MDKNPKHELFMNSNNIIYLNKMKALEKKKKDLFTALQPRWDN